MHLSQHELARVKKSSGVLRSDELVDFPQHYSLNDGDMLIWHAAGAADGRGFWSGTANFFGHDICQNYLRIIDNSNNIASLDTKIATTKEDIKNEIIGTAPETLDTLKEIADALGDPDNITGNVINKLTLHDSNISYLTAGKNTADVSINMLNNQQITNTNNINAVNTVTTQNQISTANDLTLINNLISINTSNISTNAAGVANINSTFNTYINQITDNSNNIIVNAANITSNTTNISTNTQRASQADASFNTIFAYNQSRITDICGNLARILANDNDIAGVQSKSNTNESNINNNTTLIDTNTLNITSNDSDINALTIRMNTAEGSVISHTNSLGTNAATGNTNAGNITTLTNLITAHTSSIGVLDASMARVGSIIEPATNSNLSKINTNINNIATNTTNITTNTGNIGTNTTNITSNTNTLDTLMNGTGAAGVLDTIKELADTIGDPNGIGSSIFTKLSQLDTSVINLNAEKGANDTDIATNATNISSNLQAINLKEPLIGNESLAISKIQGLTSALNGKQGTIGSNGLPMANVNGLVVALNNKQSLISDGGLTQSKVAGLETALLGKQSAITDNSLPQTKVFNLVSSLAGKQPTIQTNDLSITHIQDLQYELNQKQSLIAVDSLAISYVTGLQGILDSKATEYTPGSKITISNTGTIDTIAATHLNELADVKTGNNNAEFTNSLLIGTTTTGVLQGAINNIGIGNLALSGVNLGKNNVGIGISTLKQLSNKEKCVAIGNYALQFVNADGNVAVGFQSGQNILGGINNTFIGTKADVGTVYPNLTNTTSIGFNAKVNASNTIQLGNSQITNVNTSGKYVAGNVTYTNIDGTEGQFLRTDGNGNATFASLGEFDTTISTLQTNMNNVLPLTATHTSQITAVENSITALTNSDTSTLQLITDISNSLNNDASFAATILAEIAKKVPKEGAAQIDGVLTFTQAINAQGGINGSVATATGFTAQRKINNKPYYGQADITLYPIDLGIDYNDTANGTITSAERGRVGNIETFARTEARLGANIKLAGAIMASGDHDQDVTGVKHFLNGLSLPNNKNLSGNATSADKLKTATTINNVSFDGSQAIAITAISCSDITDIGSGKIISDGERTNYDDAVTRLNELLDDNGTILDSITEIKTALADDPSFSTTITNIANSKLALTGNQNQSVTGIKTFEQELKADGGLTGNVTGNLSGNATTATGFATQRNIVCKNQNNVVIATKPYYGQADIDIAPGDLGISYSGVATITGSERSLLNDFGSAVSTAITSSALLANGAVLTTGSHSLTGPITFNGGIIIPTNQVLQGIANVAKQLTEPPKINGKSFDLNTNPSQYAITLDADDIGIVYNDTTGTITSTERGKITTNETNISTNSGSIGTNSSNITSNTTRVGALESNTLKLSTMGLASQTVVGPITFQNGITVPTSQNTVITGNLSGNATTASRLANTNLTICGVSFTGENNITIDVEDLTDNAVKFITDNERSKIGNLDANYMATSGDQAINGVKTFNNGIIVPVGNSTVITGNLSGNATSADKLKTATTINNVSFDGSQVIEITAISCSDITDIGSGKIITASERLDIAASKTSIGNRTDIQGDLASIESALNNTVDQASGTAALPQEITGIKKFTQKLIAQAGIELTGSLHQVINYPTVVTGVTYQGTDFSTGVENPTVNVGDLAAILTNLSSNIAALSTALQAVNGKKVLD
jgi:hypothetical protein